MKRRPRFFDRAEREKLTIERLAALQTFLVAASGAPISEFPIKTLVQWSPPMGRRLSRARMWHCPQIDRRRWKHHPIRIRPNADGNLALEMPKCTCLSQTAAAKQLAVSQATISKIESGLFPNPAIEIAMLYSAFGLECLVYVLTGFGSVKFEGFPQRRQYGEGGGGERRETSGETKV